jgi:choline dehydrogenase
VTNVPAFDYVIVGAGSAGCVLADRLSADGRHSVLLLEAGGSDWHPLIHVPDGYAATIGDPRFDWRYSSGPEPHLNGRRHYCARGKVLGGTSSINGMAYSRGHRSDFDLWRQQGNAGWAWEDVRPYFLRLEDYRGDVPSRELGTAGPLTIETNRYRHPAGELLLKAAGQAGFPVGVDYNDGDPLGFAHTQMTIRDGLRISAAKAYLKQARRRRNLAIVTHAEADQLVLEQGRAHAVRYRRAGKLHTVQANREVLLCAGAVNSPLLLERSGIGDAGRLGAIGIETRHHLPGVGENLHDHLAVYVAWRLRDVPALAGPLEGLGMLRQVWSFLAGRRGFFAGTPTLVSGYARLGVGAATSDVQFFGLPAAGSPLAITPDGERSFRYDRTPGLTLSSYQCRPVSRGSVHLSSREVGRPPQIVANFLAEEADRACALAGVKLSRRIFAQPAFDPHRVEEVGPGAALQRDDEILDYVRESSEPTSHLVGSCRMGRDDRAVVDETLSVRGLRGLRIVDASIMPSIVSGNPNAAVTMIAERAADLIRLGAG